MNKINYLKAKIRHNELSRLKIETYRKLHTLSWLNHARNLNITYDKLIDELKDSKSILYEDYCEDDCDLSSEELYKCVISLRKRVNSLKDTDGEYIATEKRLIQDEIEYLKSSANIQYLNDREKLLTDEINLKCEEIDTWPQMPLSSPIDGIGHAALDESIEDELFQQKIDKLNKSYELFLKAEQFGWAESDIVIYDTIQSVYAHDVFNRPQVIHDMLSRFFPSRSKAELKLLEMFVNGQKSLKRQKKALMIAWNKHSKLLVHDAHKQIALFWAIYKQHFDDNLYKFNQNYLCNQLKEKVTLLKMNKWRELQESEQKYTKLLESSKRSGKARSERVRRHKALLQTAALKEFLSMKLDDAHKSRKNVEKDLAKSYEVIKQRKEYNAARVNARRELMDEKQQKRKEKQLHANALLNSKADQLQSFFCKVSPDVKSDNKRLMQSTKSSEMRNTSTNNEHHSNTLFTFTDDQITADSRFLLEEKLRKDGLINSAYVEQAFKKLQSAESQDSHHLPSI